MTDNAAAPPALCVLLAAGLGTRMKSSLPKVLHAVAGRPMIAHAAHAAVAAGVQDIAGVAAPGADLASAFSGMEARVSFFVQHPPLGTAHAVLAAKPAFEAFSGDVLILYGDCPLLPAEAVLAVREALSALAAPGLAVLGFNATDPTGYGRILLDPEGRPAAIREQRDATTDERAIRLCNSGVIGVRGGGLLASLLDAVRPDNAKGEYYLTDIVALAAARGVPTALVVCDEEDTLGVNDRAQLARAEAIMQRRLRARALDGGATLIAPETVTFAFDTALAPDVTVEPHVVFGPGVRVESGAVVRAFSHIEGAHIGAGSVIGPFARLRPGARLGSHVRVGNFVEVKNATLADGAKANHLSYLGDARIGADANIGAGTITCNYDGFDKHVTDIGEGAFIGSNSALVAPVTIGAGAYVGSGSVITANVAPGALAVGRARQIEKPRWADIVRERRRRPKP
ncbi:MAG: bifunctional UDP-N-acetylglucosamine diphosphorylase/glucosamine-1-phosphate N-acetyltransferase GlmU [Hyphomicrobiales bacterium]|nr:bifunctional UDP-N-acetylglucosamine diphosphorylase/glucosamine-1-phosphate N-acetyltransferase GlmU [Hyphomicrobiales bacterium]